MNGWLEMLGRTLVHFVWQGTLVACALAVVLAALGRRGPGARYLACCAALAAFVLLPLATMVGLCGVRPIAGAGFAPPLAVTPSAPDPLAPLLPWIATFWAGGVSVLQLRAVYAWLGVRRLRRSGIAPLSEDWNAVVHDLCRRLGLRHAVRVVASSVARVPMVVGWLSPMVLVPVEALTGLDRDQLRAVLAHELAHVRRYDTWVNLAQLVVETLLFYHPAVWWVSRRLRDEREFCCDDLAVGICGDPVTYARALDRLEALRDPSTLAPALAATGGALLQRIERLVRPDLRPGKRSATGPLLATLVLACGVVATGFTTASDERPQPEPAPPARPPSAAPAPAPAAAPAPPARLARPTPVPPARLAQPNAAPPARPAQPDKAPPVRLAPPTPVPPARLAPPNATPPAPPAPLARPKAAPPARHARPTPTAIPRADTRPGQTAPPGEDTRPAPAAPPRADTRPAPAATPRADTRPAPAATPRADTRPALLGVGATAPHPDREPPPRIVEPAPPAPAAEPTPHTGRLAVEPTPEAPPRPPTEPTPTLAGTLAAEPSPPTVPMVPTEPTLPVAPRPPAQPTATEEIQRELDDIRRLRREIEQREQRLLRLLEQYQRILPSKNVHADGQPVAHVQRERIVRIERTKPARHAVEKPEKVD